MMIVLMMPFLPAADASLATHMKQEYRWHKIVVVVCIIYVVGCNEQKDFSEQP